MKDPETPCEPEICEHVNSNEPDSVCDNCQKFEEYLKHLEKWIKSHKCIKCGKPATIYYEVIEPKFKTSKNIFVCCIEHKP